MCHVLNSIWGPKNVFDHFVTLTFDRKGSSVAGAVSYKISQAEPLYGDSVQSY